MTIPDFLPLVELVANSCRQGVAQLEKGHSGSNASGPLHTLCVCYGRHTYFGSDGCYMVDSLSYANRLDSSHCEKSPIHAAC